MPLVAIESPLRATDVYSREQHRRYLQECVLDSLRRGEQPYCSHWLAEILDDDNPKERAQGLLCGLSWSAKCDWAAFYTDLGFSTGMSEAMKFYAQIGKRVETRILDYKLVRMVIEMGEADSQDLTEFA